MPGVTQYRGQMMQLSEAIKCYGTGVGRKVEPEAHCLLQMSQGKSGLQDSVVRLSPLMKHEASLLVPGVTDMRIKQLLVAAVE